MFGLSQSETVSLHSFAQQYVTAASQFNQSLSLIAMNKSALSGNDRSSLEGLNMQRQQTVASLATGFLQQLSAATASRMLEIIAKGKP
jgi:hypothetical protein